MSYECFHAGRLWYVLRCFIISRLPLHSLGGSLVVLVVLNCEWWYNLIHVFKLWTILELLVITSLIQCGSLQRWWKFNTCSIDSNAYLFYVSFAGLVLVLLQLVLTTTLLAGRKDCPLLIDKQKHNLLLFIQPRWQLRIYFFNVLFVMNLHSPSKSNTRRS